jgi:hypothetical protein
MHISLDQAIGRQPRLNRVGQSLLNIASGASAAYSLRSLTGDEPRAVRIRRDGDNEERDFTTTEIATEAAAWTNGLQETTLPADHGTCAAAYSLRKVKSDYTGHAVRIRRESDDVEVNVSFDTNDEVSTSSPIENTTEQGGESGSTTATTLGEFISGTNAAVHTWYDQSGNSRNATQTTDDNQPLIAQSGLYLGELSFDGSNDTLSVATVSTLGIDGSNNKSAFAVARTTAGTDGFVIAGIDGGGSFRGLRYRSNSTNGLARLEVSNFGVEGGDLSDGNNHLYSSIFDGTQTGDFDVSLDGSITQGSGTDVINTDGTSTFFIGTVTSNSDAGFTREFILYASDQTANRTAIETNIANEYGITLS